MTTSQMLGVVATGLVIAGYVPQIVHLVKERCTAGLSIPAFSLWCVVSFLFLIHAAMIGDAVFVGVQTVNLVAGGLIVGLCKKYEDKVCPFHREAYGTGLRRTERRAARSARTSEVHQPSLRGRHAPVNKNPADCQPARRCVALPD